MLADHPGQRKITDAGIPYRVPDDDEPAARLTVIYLDLGVSEAGLPADVDPGADGLRGGIQPGDFHHLTHATLREERT